MLNLQLQRRIAMRTAAFAWDKLKGLVKLVFHRRLFILGPLAYLLGRAPFVPGIYPFGMAFFVVVVRRLPALASVLILALAGCGMGVNIPPPETYYWVVSGFVLWLIANSPKGYHGAIGFNTLFVALAGVVVPPFIALAPWYIPEFILWLPTMVAIWALSNLYLPLLEFQKRPHTTLLTKSQIAALSMLALGVLLGLSHVYVHDIHVQESIGIVLLMAAAYIGGFSAGITGGLVAGFFFALVNGDLSMMAIYGILGLFIGFGTWHKKLGIAFGLVVANLSLAFFIQNRVELFALWTLSGSALIVFTLLPAKSLRRIARVIPRTAEQKRHQDVTNKRLKEMLNQRLDDFAKVFEELSSTFTQIPSTPVASDDAYDHFLMSLTQKVCAGCPGFRSCWEERFHQTYWDMVELLAIAEKNSRVQSADLPEEIAKYCMQPYQLTTSINVVMEMLRVEAAWQRRLQESQEIVTNQLGGLSHIMRSFASQIEMDVEFDEEWELKLKAALNKQGIKPDSLRVIRTAMGKPEIHIRMKHCGGVHACRDNVAATVSKTLGQGYSVWTKECQDSGPKARCQFVLLPERSFNVEIAALKVAKDGSFISGDTHSEVWLKDGKLAVVISDGMGHGARAAMESTATIAMLKQLMQAGFDREFAVRTVNSVLLLRSTDEIFATVDLVVADLYTGELEFIKVGAPPSFLIRRTGIDVIRSNTLPIGILNHVEMEPQIRIWRHGDILLMVTDGILNGYGTLNEDWLSRIVRRAPKRDLRTIVDLVMEEAQSANNGQIKDDMTVVGILMHRRTSGADVLDTDSQELPVYDRKLA
ncbi:MAG: stage II sporulation protein E [Firmicutes bacterium]|nr:stage II sporulation protein E [Bacillota bacterium]